MALGKFRKIAKRTIVVANWLVAILFLLACLMPYLNPARWWFMGFLGLMVPHLVTLLFFFLLFWLIVKPKLAILPLFCLLIGWKQLTVLFAVHYRDKFVVKKEAATLRIVDWNIRSFLGLSNDKEKQKLNRQQVVEAIEKHQPDIICLQEFTHSLAQDNLSLFTKTYPYYYFSKDFTRAKEAYEAGCIIFSKMPLIDSGKIKYPGTLAESLIYADVVQGADTIRVYTTHLQSFQFKKTEYDGIDKLGNADVESIAASKSLFNKMKLAFTKRGIQAKIVRDVIDKSPYPSVICGDFNDVPNSFTYQHIRSDRQDAFLKKGLGIGRTYNAIASTLRIDYILPTKDFLITQFELIDEDLSDHYMLVSDIGLHAATK
jgi:endonuclease/exonuclease/phosphatase family metal-dependent hydrolase